MKRIVIICALLVAAAPAWADGPGQADLQVRIATRTWTPGVNVYLTIDVTVMNAGPDPARGVFLDFRTVAATNVEGPCATAPCAIGDLAPDEEKTIQMTAVASRTGVVKLIATARSRTPDPNRGNESVTRTLDFSTAPDLKPGLEMLPNVDPGLPFFGYFTLRNQAFNSAVAHDVVATIDLPPGVSVLSAPKLYCQWTAVRLTCTIPNFGSGRGEETQYGLPLEFMAPARYEGGPLDFRLSMTALEQDRNDEDNRVTSRTTLYRTFLVITTKDDGEGSLRAAVTASNAACEQSDLACALQFRIAEPSENPWKTIRLLSPLPPLLARRLRIDGNTQAANSGVKNPDGPSIEISGGGIVQDDGLVTGERTCRQEIANLAINGFAGHGLHVRRMLPVFGCEYPGGVVSRNYIGTDPTGTRAIPNHRGLGTSGDAMLLWISNNVLSGNTRSGLFADGGILTIQANRVGLKAKADEPLPNGGSGIYIDRDAGNGTDLTNNTIAFNGEMGVAIDPRVESAGLLQNRIWGNGGLAIDDGLDGPSPAVRTPNGPLDVPIITSVKVEPWGWTFLRGIAPPDATVELFASDGKDSSGRGEAQQYLGVALKVESYEKSADTFYLVVTKDLRGKWIAGTATGSAPGRLYSPWIPLKRTTEVGPAMLVP